MSKSADELEHEVEATREKLDQTLGDQQSRLNMASLAENLVGARHPISSLNGGAQSLLGTAKENLVPTLLISAGFGFLIYETLR